MTAPPPPAPPRGPDIRTRMDRSDGVPSPPRSAHYVAPGAPRSPLALAILGWLGAIATFIAWRQGMAVDPVVPLSAAIMGTIGLVQDYLQRREQSAGVARLAEAMATLPPEAEPMIQRGIEAALRKAMTDKVFGPILEAQEVRSED